MNFIRDRFSMPFQGKIYPNYWDIIALLLVIGAITLLAWYAKQIAVPYHLGTPIPISLDPSYLPGYALRTVSRMFIALFFSLLFTFIFATWAAKSHRAERIIIPLIDVFQSIPILGFLSAAIVGFIALFPNSLLGPECASIFAIFTSQAWNMAFGFYQTVSSVPSELREAADMFHLSSWQRFWRIDVPFSMPGLLWNTMMSMSGGWFFVVASEAVSVANQEIMLPGIGSYIALAIKSANMHAIGYAILTMFFVILIYDQLLFRPLVAWAEKFKSEQVATERTARSWVINLLHRTRLLRKLGRQMNIAFDSIINIAIFRSKPNDRLKKSSRYWHYLDGLWSLTLSLIILSLVFYFSYFILQHLPLHAVLHVFYLGIITLLRVFVLLIICSVIWVPVGVWIGLRPNAAYIAQPIAQFLASFPANLIYPILVMLIVKFHLDVNIWVTSLMILGVQWYILFNVVAGASALPKDLLQVADNFGLVGWQRWKKLILPGIFPYYITGAITAVGGAWNASIVAEIISWGDTTLVATGLGAYISEFTQKGNFLHMSLGIAMMCLFVLALNYFVWRPLYLLAQSRFSLD